MQKRQTSKQTNKNGKKDKGARGRGGLRGERRKFLWLRAISKQHAFLSVTSPSSQYLTRMSSLHHSTSWLRKTRGPSQVILHTPASVLEYKRPFDIYSFYPVWTSDSSLTSTSWVAGFFVCTATPGSDGTGYQRQGCPRARQALPLAVSPVPRLFTFMLE